MYLSECCDALPFTETYENMGKCSKCKEDTMFYEKEIIMENIYSGVFFDNDLHMTWEYALDPILPEGVKEGDEQIVELYSILSLKEIGGYGCLIYLDGVKILNQSNDKLPLHITLYTGVKYGRKVSPAEFGPILKDSLYSLPLNGYSPLKKLYSWEGTWEFYSR